MAYTSNKKTLAVETIFDVILVVTWILPMGTVVGLNHICSGWNEGSISSGTCAISLFTSFYRSVMEIFFMYLWTGYWIPVLLIAFFAYIGTVFCKIRRFFFKKQPQKKLKNNLFGFVVWGVSTVIISNIILIFFRS